jgi:hypothetical protein
METENSLSSFASLLAQRKPTPVKSKVQYRAAVGELAELIGANDKRALGKMLSRIKGKDIYAVLSEVKSEMARGKTAVHAFNLTTYVKK